MHNDSVENVLKNKIILLILHEEFFCLKEVVDEVDKKRRLWYDEYIKI